MDHAAAAFLTEVKQDLNELAKLGVITKAQVDKAIVKAESVLNAGDVEWQAMRVSEFSDLAVSLS